MTPRSAIPARIAWAVDQPAVGESDRILEIGGGRGVAAALIRARLTRGSYLGIDRSETAVSASAVRTRAHVGVAQPIASSRPSKTSTRPGCPGSTRSSPST
jgi:protein-L-isoaspartate O-methyltransferase